MRWGRVEGRWGTGFEAGQVDGGFLDHGLLHWVSWWVVVDGGEVKRVVVAVMTDVRGVVTGPVTVTTVDAVVRCETETEGENKMERTRKAAGCHSDENQDRTTTICIMHIPPGWISLFLRLAPHSPASVGLSTRTLLLGVSGHSLHLCSPTRAPGQPPLSCNATRHSGCHSSWRTDPASSAHKLKVAATQKQSDRFSTPLLFQRTRTA